MRKDRALEVGLLAVLAISVGAFFYHPASPAPDPVVPSQYPTCDVWQVGATLPPGYEGCMRDGVLVAAVSYRDGMVVYDDRMLARPGTTIHAMP